MKHVRHVLHFLLLFTCVSIQSLGQTNYYVATAAQGGNDANAGTSLAAPFSTIARAVSRATVPGDTIFVRSGIYFITSTVSINRPGTAARHIVLTAYKSDLIDASYRPILDFSSMPLASSNRGLSLSGANYWDITGLVIRGAGDNGMIVSNSSYTTINFCSFTRNRDTGLQLGNQSHHVSVINCDSYENADLGAGSTSSGGNADGFAPKLDVGDSILFRGCRAWLNSDDGWDGYLRPSNNVNTFLEDCWAFNNGYYWLDGSTTSSQNGNGFKLGGSDTKDLAHNFVVIKCLSFFNKANGFDQNSNAGSTFLYNCTAYRNGGRDFFFTSSPVTYQPGAQLVLINNISLGARGVSIPSTGTSARGLTTSTNAFSTSITSPEILSFDTAGVTGIRNPDGSLPQLSFMRLNAGANPPYTYIDRGTPLPGVIYQGMSGIPFSGAAPDLGFSESITSTLPVQLISFFAANTEKDVTLHWTIGRSINNAGFIVERATNLNNDSWTALGFVPATVRSYNDKNILPATYFYRLKQVDQDGQFSYSQVIAVTAGKRAAPLSVTTFPNPFHTDATLQFSVPSDGLVFAAIYNQQGQLIKSLLQETKKAGIHQQQISEPALPSGKYFIRLRSADQSVSTTIIKR